MDRHVPFGREALAALKKGLPDQLGRMTNKPTRRWIFQSLENTGNPMRTIPPA